MSDLPFKEKLRKAAEANLKEAERIGVFLDEFTTEGRHFVELLRSYLDDVKLFKVETFMTSVTMNSRIGQPVQRNCSGLVAVHGGLHLQAIPGVAQVPDTAWGALPFMRCANTHGVKLRFDEIIYFTSEEKWIARDNGSVNWYAMKAFYPVNAKELENFLGRVFRAVSYTHLTLPTILRV